MTFTFDWDGCLESSAHLQNVFRKLALTGVRLYIVTNRAEDDPRNQDLYAFIACGNPFLRYIYFTDDKVKTLKELNVHLHFDDDLFEVARINEALPGVAVPVNYTNADFLAGESL